MTNGLVRSPEETSEKWQKVIFLTGFQRIDKSIVEAEQLTNIDIAKELRLPPVKLHCSMLAEDAIKAAINDYKQKSNLQCCGNGCENCVG